MAQVSLSGEVEGEQQVCAAMRDSDASMKDTNKTYAIVEVIDGEKIQLVRPSFSYH